MKKQKKEVKKESSPNKNSKPSLEKESLKELEGGIRIALSRGEELKKIMLSYYNAGYPKEDIQEATKRAQQKEIKVIKEEDTKKFQKNKKHKENKKTEKIENKQKGKKPKEKKKKMKQSASKYSNNKKKITIIIIMVMIFIILGGGIAYLFMSGII